MTFAEKHNKKFFNIDTTDFEFKSLESLYEEHKDKPIVLRGVYINTKSKYGEKPIFATNNELVSMPKHMLKTAVDIINCDEDVESINNGNIGFIIKPYVRNDETFYTVEFVMI